MNALHKGDHERQTSADQRRHIVSATSPIVNRNGTDRAALRDERMTAIRALHEAQMALEAVTVNGRDYIGDDLRLDRALAAHIARITAVRLAIKDLTDEVIALRS